MNIGVYGGFTHLTGKPLDGMPALHSTNFIIDAGVKFSFAFGSKKRSGKRVLGQWLIPADRVETVGGGIKRDAASEAEARNASTIEIMK